MQNLSPVMTIALVPFLALASHAAPITGGMTTIEVVVPLEELGLEGDVRGDATGTRTDDGTIVVKLPVTGGNETDGEYVIEHEGGGLALHPIGDEDAVQTGGDFVVDTATGTVSGDIEGEPFGTLFNFGSETEDGTELLVSDKLAEALDREFGASSLAGTVAAIATLAPEVGKDS